MFTQYFMTNSYFYSRSVYKLLLAWRSLKLARSWTKQGTNFIHRIKANVCTERRWVPLR